MKKRVLSLMLATVMMFVFTACGGGNKDAGSANADKNSVNSTGVLRVGMECAYAPYNWTQSDNSNGAVPIADSGEYAYGYDIMMAKKLADELGWKLEIHKMDFGSLPLAVKTGSIDCAIAGQSITPERLQSVDFTEPYYYADVIGLVRKDSKFANVKSVSDLKGASATSQLNTIWYDVLDQIPDVKKQPAVDTVPNLTVALSSGSIDFVCCDRPTALAAVSANPSLKIIDFDGGTGFKVSDSDVNIGSSVRQGNIELTDTLNSVLKTMTADDFNAMMDEAIKVQPLSALQ